MSSTEKKPAPIIFGDETLSDVTLVVGNQDFKTNKMFLAYHSDFFKAMFYGNFKESKEDRVEIKDVSVTNFRRLLEIIHNGKISDTHEFMEFPFARGKHYVIYCYNGYGERTDDQNASHHTNSQQDFFYNFWKSTTEILNIADRFNLSPMVKDYFGYIIPLSISYCGQDWCHICLNYYIFALLNGIDVSKCKKTFPKELYLRWTKYATKKPFPDIIPIKGMITLFDHLH